MKPCVMVFLGNYLPGFKSGGPARTIANMVERLGDEFQFKIVTRDRDLGDTSPYEGIRAGSWEKVAKALVYYLPYGHISYPKMCRLTHEAKPDILYLNSFFSSIATIRPLFLRYVGLMPNVPMILAPRGEFSTEAINSKKLKKMAYLALSKIIGYYGNIIWQASSDYEAKDIKRVFGENIKLRVAPDLSQADYHIDDDQTFPPKETSSIKIAFLARISPVKNLLMALDVLNNVKGDVTFDIYGPIEDENYWNMCKVCIDALPGNIKAKYCGAVVHSDVVKVLRDYHLFFCPTKGENFGHAILEAMVSGCPVLISDRTPWRGLQNKGAGWDLPLGDSSAFVSVLNRCVKMDAGAYCAMRKRTRDFAINVTKDETIVEQNRKLFREAMNL